MTAVAQRTPALAAAPPRPERGWERADLWLLGAMLLLTGAFGRDFSRIELPGTPAYVTELALVAIGVLAVARHGLRASWAILRRRLPLIALAVFWAAGAVAAVRGLTGPGFELMKQDVGLVEFSLWLPIVALVVDDGERLRAAVGVLVWASAVAAVLTLTDYAATALFEETVLPNPSGGTATGLYASLLPVWVLSRYAVGRPVSAIQIAFAALGLLAVGLTDQRGLWLAAAIALLAVVALAPTERRLRALAAAGAAIIFLGAGTYSVQWVVDRWATTPSEFELLERQRQQAEEARERGEPPGPADAADDDAGDERGPQVAREVSGVFRGGDGTQEGDNVAWRVAIWQWGAEESLHRPVTGVGFGTPMDYSWHGKRYDTRETLSNGALDVSGPHNEFVHIAYRMGLVALAALVLVIALALVRGVGALRDPAAGADRRALVLALCGMTVAAIVTAGFNDALKVPYMSLFFWVPLGLLLVAPHLVERDKTAALP